MLDANVLIALTVAEHEHHEPIGQCAARVGEPGELVAQDHESGLESAGDRFPILPVDRQRVLAGDRQEPLHDRGLIRAAG